MRNISFAKPRTKNTKENTLLKYKSFYREKEHEKYIKKRDKKKGLILFGELTEVLIAETKEDAPKAIESKEYQEYMQRLIQQHKTERI